MARRGSLAERRGSNPLAISMHHTLSPIHFPAEDTRSDNCTDEELDALFTTGISVNRISSRHMMDHCKSDNRNQMEFHTLVSPCQSVLSLGTSSSDEDFRVSRCSSYSQIGIIQRQSSVSSLDAESPCNAQHTLDPTREVPVLCARAIADNGNSTGSLPWASPLKELNDSDNGVTPAPTCGSTAPCGKFGGAAPRSLMSQWFLTERDQFLASLHEERGRRMTHRRRSRLSEDSQCSQQSDFGDDEGSQVPLARIVRIGGRAAKRSRTDSY